MTFGCLLGEVMISDSTLLKILHNHPFEIRPFALPSHAFRETDQH